jgi:hypothetical protein
MQTKPDSAALYLELMKKTLSYSLWKEPGVPIETFNYKRTFLKKKFVNFITNLAQLAGWQIVKNTIYDEKEKEQGLIWPLQADTMIGLRRLDNIQFCIQNVLDDHIEGDLIETGAWRGGACIFMRAILAAYGITDKRVFVADSFAGLPEPDEQFYPQDQGDIHFTERVLAVSQEEVEHNFRKYGLLDEQVVFLKGWFKDTLPNAPIEKLSVMRLDGDMYQSTIEALTYLYPKLSGGGYCIIDDYALKGCRQAVDEFRTQNRIAAALGQIDWTGVYWRKEQ